MSGKNLWAALLIQMQTGTLRVTYGNVMGGSPKDGLIYEPFTRLEGITEKDTGETPFDSPKKQLELIEDKKYGPYKLDAINSVPVNFLTDLDSTGGKLRLSNAQRKSRAYRFVCLTVRLRASILIGILTRKQPVPSM